MPRIASFYGIVIWMYWRDHQPPHFHAKYQEHEVLIEIQNLSIYAGSLPARALGLVIEWASQHQVELMENWNLALQDLPLKKIESLN
ncbi:MAG: DUF4160 domain-containing protein [Chitinophagaceae bacterium]|nr:DUF4160 domain-containing protein [Chitinophagaceae bacterium]